MDNQFWVELGCLLLSIPCLDSYIFVLGFGVFLHRIVKYVRVLSCSGVEMPYKSRVGIGEFIYYVSASISMLKSDENGCHVITLGYRFAC